MDHGRFRCCQCHRVKPRRTQDQRYCDDPSCQQARRNAWRRDKYASDADYRANQRASTDAWLAAQGGSAAWYRDYRRRRRDAIALTEPSAPGPSLSSPKDEIAEDASLKASAAPRAKRDPAPSGSGVTSGTYRLIAAGAAKRDAIIVELRLISSG